MGVDRISDEARIRVETQDGDLEVALAQAGLELWESPEGFWAVRLKPVVPPAPTNERRAPRRSR